MSWGYVAAAVITAVGVGSAAEDQEDAAHAAAQAARRGVNRQETELEAFRRILSPYVEAGAGGEGVSGSLQATQELLGLRGADAQGRAISSLEASPLFTSMIQQGEDAILSNAAATGGLRGGNVQGALARYRPALLSSVINQQLDRYGQLTQIGQASAAGVGSAGIQTGQGVAASLEAAGANAANARLAQAQTYNQGFASLANLAGEYFGRQGSGGKSGGGF